MLPDLTMSNVESFWSRVDKSGDCWLWTGYTDPAGYGQLRLGGERYRAHRLAWELLNGPIPDGMYLCHNCPTGDNPSCVNPSHIFLGTHTQNMQDCTAKGMRAAGEGHGGAKLTYADVLVIRLLGVNESVRCSDMAIHFGVSAHTIRRVIAGGFKTHREIALLRCR